MRCSSTHGWAPRAARCAPAGRCIAPLVWLLSLDTVSISIYDRSSARICSGVVFLLHCEQDTLRGKRPTLDMEPVSAVVDATLRDMTDPVATPAAAKRWVRIENCEWSEMCNIRNVLLTCLNAVAAPAAAVTR